MKWYILIAMGLSYMVKYGDTIIASHDTPVANICTALWNLDEIKLSVEDNGVSHELIVRTADHRNVHQFCRDMSFMMITKDPSGYTVRVPYGVKVNPRSGLPLYNEDITLLSSGPSFRRIRKNASINISKPQHSYKWLNYVVFILIGIQIVKSFKALIGSPESGSNSEIHAGQKPGAAA